MPGSVSEDADARPTTPDPLRRAVRQRCGFQAARLPCRYEDPRPGTRICLPRTTDARLRAVGSLAPAGTAGNRMAPLGARALEARCHMIDKRDILEAASALGLLPNVVEKDYVLGWVLAGIHAHPELTNSWIFKGGTCLKKCYFETYRFSGHLEEGFLQRALSDVVSWVSDQSGLAMPAEQLSFDFYQNPRGRLSCQGKIGYSGPASPASAAGGWPKIKLDLTADETLVLQAV